MAVAKDASGNLVLKGIAASGSLSAVDTSSWSQEQILRGLFSDNADGTFGVNIDGLGGSGSIADGSITNAKLATVPTLTIKGKNTAGTGPPLDLTVAQVQTMLANTLVVTSSTGTSPSYSATEYVIASVTRTLPTAGTTDVGKTITYKAVGAIVTIAVGANTIDGASSSIAIASGDSMTFAVRAANSVERIYGLVASSVGSGITTYSAGNGAIVSATGAGVTFTRTSASVWVFAIPSGVRLLSYNIYSASGANPGAGVDIAFNYTSNSVTNQGASTAEIPTWSVMQDAGSGFNQITVGSGATSFKPNTFTSASGNLSFTAIQTGNASTGATIIKGSF